MADAVTDIGTDKVLAASKTAIGWLIFNAPEKHNAHGLEMSQGVAARAQGLCGRRRPCASWCWLGRRAGSLSVADISEFEKNRSNAQQAEKYAESAGGAHAAVRNLLKPTNRHDPRPTEWEAASRSPRRATCESPPTTALFAIPSPPSIAYRIEFMSWIVHWSGRRNRQDSSIRAPPEGGRGAGARLVNRVVPAAQL